MGKPYKESANEAYWTAAAFDYYAEISRDDAGRVVVPVVDGDLNLITKHPLDVVGIILPFNFPYLLFGWEASAALGAGNAVILKPSELTTFSSLIMMECFDHLPKGLVQCIPGAIETGKALVGHEAVDGIGCGDKLSCVPYACRTELVLPVAVPPTCWGRAYRHGRLMCRRRPPRRLRRQHRPGQSGTPSHRRHRRRHRCH